MQETKEYKVAIDIKYDNKTESCHFIDELGAGDVEVIVETIEGAYKSGQGGFLRLPVYETNKTFRIVLIDLSKTTEIEVTVTVKEEEEKNG